MRQEFWKVENVKLFFVKYNLIFGARYYNRKNNIFPIMDTLSSIAFKKNPEEKNF